MLRAQLMRRGPGKSDGFRLRGTDVTRLEGFSDTVFGFAVTLLVVSLDVPTSFNDLINTMRDLLPFAVCFAILCLLWYQHYRFFRRYGLHDTTMIVLNSLLLFVILAYIYPLKFLFRGFIGSLVGIQTQQAELTGDQLATVFVIYGLGWVAVYTIFAIFYLHAYRRRASLELNALETFDTRTSIYRNLGMVGVGLLSVLLGLLHVGISIGLPGWAYFLIAPMQALVGSWAGARQRVLAERLSRQSVEASPQPAPASDASS
jgi:hypothetical protein